MHRFAVVSAAMLLGIAAIVMPSHASASTTYDLVSDWGSTSNPDGPWAFWQGSNLLPYQSSVAALGGLPAYAPSPNYGNFLPAFWQSNGTGSDIYVHSVDSYNGNPALGQVALTWTAPVTGTIDISGYLYYAQYGLQRSNDFLLYLGGTLLDSGTLSYLTSSGPADETTLSFSDLAVTAGEVLSLVLQRSAGQTAGTETGFDFTVTETTASTVSEPMSLALLGMGLTGLGTLRRRRNSAN